MPLLRFGAAIVLSIVFVVWMYQDPQLTKLQVDSVRTFLHPLLFGFGAGTVIGWVITAIEVVINSVTAEPETLSITNTKENK